VRLSVVLLACSLLGLAAGGWLIGRWALGVAIMVDSLLVGLWALFRDDGRTSEPQVHGVPTLAQVLEKARHAS
jgi:hypothetical protein